jgi:hypothetical protein
VGLDGSLPRQVWQCSGPFVDALWERTRQETAVESCVFGTRSPFECQILGLLIVLLEVDYSASLRCFFLISKVRKIITPTVAMNIKGDNLRKISAYYLENY